MSRRFTIVSYDVTDDKRRDRVAGVLLDYGDRVQYSVFCCQVSAREMVQLQTSLKERLNLEQDRVLLIDAGPVEGQKPQPDVNHIGKPYVTAFRTQIV